MSSAPSEPKYVSALKRISKVLPEWAFAIRLRGILQLNNAILFHYGWLRSLRFGKAVDAEGNPLPWITYPCIDFLKQFDYSDKSVFEWGAGQSTLFWSARAKRVVSVEADPVWFERVRKTQRANCAVLLRPRELESYVNAIEQDNENYDVIVIDGPSDFRPACSRAATKRLRMGGIVVLDNSDQSLNSARILRDAGLVQVDFTGFVPGLGYPHTSSIFFDRSYDLRPLNGIQPQRSVAQPNLPWPDA